MSDSAALTPQADSNLAAAKVDNGIIIEEAVPTAEGAIHPSTRTVSSDAGVPTSDGIIIEY